MSAVSSSIDAERAGAERDRSGIGQLSALCTTAASSKSDSPGSVRPPSEKTPSSAGCEGGMARREEVIEV